MSRVLCIADRHPSMQSVSLVERLIHDALRRSGHAVTRAFAGEVDRTAHDALLANHDVIIALGVDRPLVSERYKRGSGPPILLPSWGLGTRGLLPIRQRFLLKGDGIFFPSTVDFAAAARHFRSDDLNLFLLPFALGPTFERATPVSERDTSFLSERSIAHSTSCQWLLCLGRVNHQKNIHLLLPLLEWLRNRGIEAKLLIAGLEDESRFPELHWQNTAYQDYLARAITALGLEPHVHFLGDVEEDDLPRLLAAIHVGVSASTFRTEDFGFAPIECAAMGRPFVGTGWGGFWDTIRHGMSGFIIPVYGSATGFRVDWRTGAAWVERLLRDSSLYHSISRYGATVVRAQFSSHVFCARLSDIIDNLAMRSAKGRIDIFDLVDDVTRLYLTEVESRLALGEPDSTARGGQFTGRNRARLQHFFGSYVTPAAIDWRPEDVPYNPLPYVCLDNEVELIDPSWGSLVRLEEKERLIIDTLGSGVTLAQLGSAYGIDISVLIAAARSLGLKGVILPEPRHDFEVQFMPPPGFLHPASYEPQGPYARRCDET